MLMLTCHYSFRGPSLLSKYCVRRGADKSSAFPIFLYAAEPNVIGFYFHYVGVLVKSLAFLIFLLESQPKEFFLDELKKLEQRNHNCVELRGEYVE
jgi:hypothetical protein